LVNLLEVLQEFECPVWTFALVMLDVLKDLALVFRKRWEQSRNQKGLPSLMPGVVS
jgi:hypothetical protein